MGVTSGVFGAGGGLYNHTHASCLGLFAWHQSQAAAFNTGSVGLIRGLVNSTCSFAARSVRNLRRRLAHITFAKVRRAEREIEKATP